MGRQISVLLILLLTQEAVRSIRVSMDTQERIVAEGRDATLVCRFDVPEQQLYSVRWYKGDDQFYSYMPSGEPPDRIFHVEGVNVSRVSPQEVTLTGITRETAGLYRCEVIGEAPRFPISSAEKYVEVHLLPESGPLISGAREQYRVGDVVDVNCTTKPSRPVTHLTWWVDNENAQPSQLHSEVVRRIETIDATSTTLRLTFTIGTEEIPQMTLTCLANIGLAYHSRAVHRSRVLPSQMPPPVESVFEKNYAYTEPPTSFFVEDSTVDNDGSSSISNSGFVIFIHLFLICISILISF